MDYNYSYLMLFQIFIMRDYRDILQFIELLYNVLLIDIYLSIYVNILL